MRARVLIVTIATALLSGNAADAALLHVEVNGFVIADGGLQDIDQVVNDAIQFDSNHPIRGFIVPGGTLRASGTSSIETFPLFLFLPPPVTVLATDVEFIATANGATAFFKAVAEGLLTPAPPLQGVVLINGTFTDNAGDNADTVMATAGFGTLSNPPIGGAFLFIDPPLDFIADDNGAPFNPAVAYALSNRIDIRLSAAGDEVKVDIDVQVAPLPLPAGPSLGLVFSGLLVLVWTRRLRSGSRRR